MLCQICGKRSASTHITEQVNGYCSELYVCSSCAAKKGLNVSQFVFSDPLYSNMFARPFLKSSTEVERCPDCNRSFLTIVREGKIGCPTCYTTFYDRLKSSIQRIHGKATHIGKTGNSMGKHTHGQDSVAALKEELDAALKAQNYERCAELRDRIKALEEDEV